MSHDHRPILQLNIGEEPLISFEKTAGYQGGWK